MPVNKINKYFSIGVENTDATSSRYLLGFRRVIVLCDRTLVKRVFDHKTSQAIGSAIF